MSVERILLIEESKPFSNILAKKMHQTFGFDIIQAYSFEEACAYIEENDDFFVALCDLNLTDTSDGTMIDFVISHGIATIVLTSNDDDALDAEILKKHIVDCVQKDTMDDIHYVFSRIQRLKENLATKILVVDDAMVLRDDLKHLLEMHKFNVYVAAHGEEAMHYLQEHHDIKIIITDDLMPVMGGMELLKALRIKYDKNERIVIVLSASAEPRVASKFLRNGANDFLKKPLDKEELILRIDAALDATHRFERLLTMAKDLLKREIT